MVGVPTPISTSSRVPSYREGPRRLPQNRAHTCPPPPRLEAAWSLTSAIAGPTRSREDWRDRLREETGEGAECCEGACCCTSSADTPC